MRTIAGVVLALLLAACTTPSGGDPGLQLSNADVRFIVAIRANTRTLFDMGDVDMALAGHDVCTILGEGGTTDLAARLVVPSDTIRERQDGAYFATVAAHSFCPQYPTAKPAPTG